MNDSYGHLQGITSYLSKFRIYQIFKDETTIGSDICAHGARGALCLFHMNDSCGHLQVTTSYLSEFRICQICRDETTIGHILM